MLEGIKILDFSIGISGPYCTRLLADWGARVLKIERPGGGDVSREWDSVVHGMSSGYVWVNRNKESITLNLKNQRAREIVYKLVEDADIVVENFTPGTVNDLGIDYETLCKINPHLIYCHISGYGQDGPYKDEKAYDLLMQGESGIILMNGSPEAPAKVPLSICDLTSGMFAALGIMMALYNRTTKPSKQGQELEVTMFDSMVSLLGYFPHFYWYRGELPVRVGMKHHLLTPYGPYLAKDGKYISYACLSQDHWRKFCYHVIERPELPEMPEFENNEKRLANREELEKIVAGELLKRNRDEWLERLRAVGIPCGRVNDLEEVLTHPQLIHRGLVRNLDTPYGEAKEIDNPIRFSGHTSKMDYVPELGEHTAKILAELGFSEDQISELRAKLVI